MDSVEPSSIEATILACMEMVNQSREPDQQLAVHGQAPIFGPDSPLDSLGLVSLLIDIEDSFADRGTMIHLSDERAMSQKRNPYRDVPTLVAYIGSQLEPSHADHP